MVKLNSHQLRRSQLREAQKIHPTLKKNPLVLVLDNVLDTYNIGSFFRLADALAVEKICLCGPCVTPPNLKIHRSSIGTWKWVKWEHFHSTSDCLQQLKTAGYQLVACEQTKTSINYQTAQYAFPLAIVAGSESNGVGESVLKLCDQVVEIPMFGVNKSLNVLIATSIIAFDSVSKMIKK